MKFNLLLIALCTTTALTTDPVPTPFPNVWSANFSESLVQKQTGHQTTNGIWYYNFDLKKFLVVRENGAADTVCGPLSNYKNTTCHTLVTGGKRYVYFPEIKSCCHCCDDADGCGMEKPNWFVNGKYLGQRYDNGYLVNVWNIQANQPNYVSQISGEKYNGVTLRVFQVPNSNMVYDPATVSNTVDPKVFDLPVGVNCQRDCPAPSVCAKFRGSSLKSAEE